jgi:hypothetical protein
MSSKGAKVAARAGGAAPVVGMLAAASIKDPWLAIAVVSFLCALAVAVGWLLLQRPFLEISETVQEGNRKRVWRAGVAEPAIPNVATPSPLIEQRGRQSLSWLRTELQNQATESVDEE